jgi:hypothetical protein
MSGMNPGARALARCFNLHYLLYQSNQVKDDIKCYHGSPCLTGAKWARSMQGYKREYLNYFNIRIYYPLDSLSLLSIYRHLTDLTVGGDFAGQPPTSLCCFASQDMDEGTSLMMPHHGTKICTNIYIYIYILSREEKKMTKEFGRRKIKKMGKRKGLSPTI